MGDVVRILPELAANLRAIRRATESMASEVRGMHTGVRRIELQVVELRDQVARMDGRVLAVEEHMGRLEPHIAEVNLAVRPLRRARARLAQRAPAPAPDATNQFQNGLPDYS